MGTWSLRWLIRIGRITSLNRYDGEYWAFHFGRKIINTLYWFCSIRKLMRKKIDEVQLYRLVRKVEYLKYKFNGVIAPDEFLLSAECNTFVIMDFERADRGGIPWLLLCNRNGKYLLADSLGLPTHNLWLDRLSYAEYRIEEVIKEPLQKASSCNCGLYCLYIVHYIYTSYYPSIPFISKLELLPLNELFCRCFVSVRSRNSSWRTEKLLHPIKKLIETLWSQKSVTFISVLRFSRMFSIVWH